MRQTKAKRKRAMAVAIDKHGVAHIAATKREAARKAKEANDSYK